MVLITAAFATVFTDGLGWLGALLLGASAVGKPTDGALWSGVLLGVAHRVSALSALLGCGCRMPRCSQGLQLLRHLRKSRHLSAGWPHAQLAPSLRSALASPPDPARPRTPGTGAGGQNTKSKGWGSSGDAPAPRTRPERRFFSHFFLGYACCFCLLFNESRRRVTGKLGVSGWKQRGTWWIRS